MKQSAQLVVALDVDTLKQSRYFVDMLYPTVRLFKVGSQLFTACGPEAVKMVGRKGAKVFLDLKFHDIPNTVANAVRQAAALKVKMLTLHIAGGDQMLKAAIGAAGEGKAGRPLLIGVTVLTSQKAAPSEVIRLAKAGIACGLDGVVASVKETKALRRAIKKDFIIVTPGIRPAGAQRGDQRRVATAEEAAKAGSNFLVVGRPILEARDPLQAAKEIIAHCKERDRC